MTRIITFVDIVLFLLSLFTRTMVEGLRSSHRFFYCLTGFCTVLVILSLLLSYRCVMITSLRNPYILDNLPSQSNYLYTELSNATIQAALHGQKIPFTVHYMWCRKSVFEYKHYISVMSVAKVLKPDQIVFHYLEMPLSDKKGYFTWFEELQQQIAMLSLRPIHRVWYCGHDFPERVFKDRDFPNPNGVFMTDDIAVTGLSRELIHKLVFHSLCPHHVTCIRQTAEKFQLFLVPESEPYSLAQDAGKVVLQCPVVSAFNQANVSWCVQLNQRLFPGDVWLKNGSFDVFVRNIAYSSLVPLVPVQSTQVAAPEIAHILRFDGDGILDPLCYSSIKSVFVFGQMKHAFLHGHTQVRGPLWEKLTHEHAVTFVAAHVFVGSSSVFEEQLYGLYTLLQYGGMLTTCDVIVQQPAGTLLHLPLVLSVHRSEFHIIHHHVDFSLLFAKPGSVFLKTFIPVLKQMSTISSGRDVGAVAYHIYEQLPDAVFMKNSLCSHYLCTDSKCKRSPAEVSQKQAFCLKLQFVSQNPASLKQLKSLKLETFDLFQELISDQ